MATAVIPAARGRVHPQKCPTTPRRRHLSGWTRMLGHARRLRAELLDLNCAPELDAAVGNWLVNGEAIALVLAAKTHD